MRRMARRDSAITAEAEEILLRMHALRRDLRRNPAEDARRAGLTAPQVSAMACLVTKGALTLTELSRTLGMNHSTASGIVDRLQSRGLVRRTPDPGDRRRTRISVTDKVTRYVHELERGPSGRLAAALENASPAERRAILKGLHLLGRLLRSQP
jgi:DNA-binding MarR family transcriptional regulator